VFGKQRFGCAPGRDILHGPSPCFANPSAPAAAVKQARESHGVRSFQFARRRAARELLQEGAEEN